MFIMNLCFKKNSSKYEALFVISYDNSETDERPSFSYSWIRGYIDVNSNHIIWAKEDTSYSTTGKLDKADTVDSSFLRLEIC